MRETLKDEMRFQPLHPLPLFLSNSSINEITLEEVRQRLCLRVDISCAFLLFLLRVLSHSLWLDWGSKGMRTNVKRLGEVGILK